MEAQKEATIWGYTREEMSYEEYMNSPVRWMALPPPQTSNIPHRDHRLQTIVHDAAVAAVACMCAKPSGSDSKLARASKQFPFLVPQPKVKLGKNNPAAVAAGAGWERSAAKERKSSPMADESVKPRKRKKYSRHSEEEESSDEETGNDVPRYKKEKKRKKNKKEKKE